MGKEKNKTKKEKNIFVRHTKKNIINRTKKRLIVK
jgi:hypothetical protein